MSTQEKSINLAVGQNINYDDVIIQLHNFGYERQSEISSFGQFSAVGDTIKIYCCFDPNPIAIEFWGNNIESIYSFSLAKKNKIEKYQKIHITENHLRLPGIKIKPGDFVVHEDHGIGIYKSKVKKQLAESYRQFYSIEYLNGDNLYVPESAKNKITVYQGVGRRQPRLSRLGSPVWQKTKKKVEQSIIHLARELLEVYAKRELVEKDRVIKIDKKWDRKLAESFEHIETPDQETAIAEIYADLEKSTPMDRLLIGDVGFGKTEVAIRAATQVINNGFQVVILAPTTILSRQHYKTISKRLQDFPIKIAELSRFVSAEKQKEVEGDLSSGSIDLLVGTHRVLNTNLRFKRLGLLIIDEEQKFGVKGKEKLKTLKTDVDVLSMSATPIPRTLFISLSGIRQISVIKTPPKNRRPIVTKVEQYNDSKIIGYIKRELKRGGQVYFLYNDVKTIQAKNKKLKKLLPEARISFAHGQMSENDLATVMAGFAAGDIDVLVCSTIIENGLDIPQANTLIIEDADRFGLSQLYQLRGRIGRGLDQAYAYITFKKKLVGNAYKRLSALAEKTDLGSGFDIAFSDLEIRGGGNILGRQQHGNMEELGLILYTKLLEQAVKRIKKNKDIAV